MSVTPADIVERMMDLGFEPSRGAKSGEVVFAKHYDRENEMRRVLVFFDSPAAGTHGIRLANVVVTVTKAYGPDLDEVQDAPADIRGDLVDVFTSFPDILGAIPDQAVDIRACVSCGVESSEYYVVNNDAICARCVRERQSG